MVYTIGIYSVVKHYEQFINSLVNTMLLKYCKEVKVNDTREELMKIEETSKSE